MTILNSKKLQEQSNIKIDKWIDIESKEAKKFDKVPHFTKRLLKIGLQDPPFLFFDELGGLWIRDNASNKYHPLHDEHDGKLFGWRLSRRAAN